MATAVYGAQQSYASTTSYAHDAPAQNASQSDDGQYIPTFFCRALYDYQSADDSSLSFRKGDIIEVLTRLETGWWDGLLADERGWFPSNYVAVISDEEADVALAASELHHSQQMVLRDNASIPTSHSTSTMPSMSSSTSTSRSQSQADHGNWLERETEYVPPRNGVNDITTTTLPNSTQSSDFWVPQVTPDGQVSPSILSYSRYHLFGLTSPFT